MTEDLRALLRADLSAERPPPLGDVVAAAIRDGRRIRRMRRLRTFAAAAVVFAVLASGAVLVGDGRVAARHEAQAAVGPPVLEHEALPPQTVPIMPGAPTGPPQARTLTIHSGTVRADGLQKKATSAAMLHLLTLLLPPGRTSHYGVAPNDDLQVQLYLDDGDGPAMVRVGLEKNAPSGEQSPRGATVTVTIRFMPDDCEQSTVVDAGWPDGTAVRVGVATCLPFDDSATKDRTRPGGLGGPRHRPTRAALSIDQAIRVASDPRWGVTMDESLVSFGAKQFPRLPVLS